MAARFNFPVDYGEVVIRAIPGSPAYVGGIVSYSSTQASYQYDIITAVNGESLDQERELLDLVREHETGDSISLDIYRITDGEFEAMQLELTLEAIPPEAPLSGII